MKNKKRKNIKRKINKKVSKSRFGDIRAFTVLSLSKRKLNFLDEEEELHRSVLISNTMKSVKQEMSMKEGKKDGKKPPPSDETVKKVKNRIGLLKSHSHRRFTILKRKVSRLVRGRKKLKRFKCKENLMI